MRVVNIREFRNCSASVLDAVEAGESIAISRNGVEIAEVRPIVRRRTFVPLTDLLQALTSRRGGANYAQIRADQDAFFGDECDRI